MEKLYSQMTAEELKAEQKALEKRFNDFKAKGLKLDMSRGKPGADQLDLSSQMNDVKDYVSDGVDIRNYGILDGIPSCKKLFADLMGVDSKNVIVGPNASLTLMFDYISQCYTHGAGDTPWCRLPEVKFLCPVPGYDRHFTILEYFGIKMINIAMKADGPDMDAIEEYIKDDSVKGMFCVPKYSNPQGITYSDAVVKRIAAMKPAAKVSELSGIMLTVFMILIRIVMSFLIYLTYCLNTVTRIWLLRFVQPLKSHSRVRVFRLLLQAIIILRQSKSVLMSRL